MTAKEYIIIEYGETWLRAEWSAGDVMDIMEDYAIHRIEEEERLFRERIESDAELWGRVGAKPPRLSNSTDPMPKEDKPDVTVSLPLSNEQILKGIQTSPRYQLPKEWLKNEHTNSNYMGGFLNAVRWMEGNAR